jgi:toxin HigB-1
MIITFAEKDLRAYANNKKLAIRKLGSKRAEVFNRRLDDLAASISFADLGNLPGRFHQLTGDRSDQWSCDLDHPYRLVFEPTSVSIPKDSSGRQILSEITSLRIIEITNYHKER